MAQKKTKVVYLGRMVRWFFRFDTVHEERAFVSLIDANVSLRKEIEEGGAFYRLSLQIGKDYYTLIFHKDSLMEEYPRVFLEYAEQSGGAVVEDEALKTTLTKYALVRYFSLPSDYRVDDPLPKTN